MTPATHDLTAYRGDPFDVTMTLAVGTTPVNLTGSTILAQVRERAVNTDPAGTFTATITDAAAGTFTLSLSPEQTSTIPGGVYDVQITDTQGVPRTYVAGKISFTQDVSRAA